MPVIKSKPTSPGRRFVVQVKNPELKKGKPYKPLIEKKNKSGGRNNKGRITTRHIGGGHKQRYRIIDFKRNKDGIPGKVERLEYDPNRSARLALLNYADGEKRYIIAPSQLQIGAILMSGPDAEPSLGNALPLSKIPAGMAIHNIELVAGRGGQLVRSAGASAVLMSHAEDYANVKMPSGEVRLIRTNCMATVGRVGNVEHSNIVMGKAGRKRWLGIRPTVRGVAMNPVDHPMGGGEGRTSGGGHPQSPWGLLSKGKRTRKKHKQSNRYIIERRKK